MATAVSFLVAVCLSLAAAPAAAAAVDGGAPCGPGAWCPLEPPPQLDDFYSVWGASPREVWASCYELKANGARLLRWDGARWTRVPGIPDVWIKKIWGSAANDVWAVGDAVLHWDGATWSQVPVHLWFTLNDVRGTAADDVWAVGNDGVLHFDGKTWSIVYVKRETNLEAVWPAGAVDVWAVGRRDTALRWNGKQWVELQVPDDVWLWSVWADAPDDVWAVGNKGSIIHWQGAAGTKVASPTDLALQAIWGTGPNAIWATGQHGALIRWDGRSWQAGPPIAAADLLAIWGDASGPRWAVGRRGAIVFRAAEGRGATASAPRRVATARRPPMLPDHSVGMPPMSDPRPVPGAAPPRPADATRVAREWLEAARDRQIRELRRRSVLPLVIDGFDFGGGPRVACGGRGDLAGGFQVKESASGPAGRIKGLRAEAKSDEGFLSALDCFFRDDFLARYAPQSPGDWRRGGGPGDHTGVLTVVTARSSSRRLIRYREALGRLDRSHLIVQAVMTDHHGVTNTVALALRQIDGVPRVAAVYIDELFEE